MIRIHRFFTTIFIAHLAVLTQGAADEARVTKLADHSNQRSYSALKRPIQSEVLDTRFTTSEAMYLANEEVLSAFRFFERAAASGMPVVEDKDLFNITTIESYWYSRYNLSWLEAKSRMGIVLVHGPYVTLKALEQKGRVFYSRNRGERPLANRDVLLGQIIPSYINRVGKKRRYEDASPLMLEFASGDPTLVRAVDQNDDFEGGNKVIDYEDDYSSLRWNASKMDKIIDMGGVGQALWKQVLWCEYFFKGKHDKGTHLGNDEDEGFRGCMLTLMSVSKMLALKSSLFYDGKKLTGLNPTKYDPNRKLMYLPHRIRPELIMLGDIPPRPQWYTVKDASSHLYDQASILLGLVQYVNFSDEDAYIHYALPKAAYPYGDVFGDNCPQDGSIMEKKWTKLARSMSHVILKNIDAMHRAGPERVLVSRWDPDGKANPKIDIFDAGLAMVSLQRYSRHLRKNRELNALAKDLLKREADYLLSVQGEDGSFAASYNVTSGRATDPVRSLRAQAGAVRGLLAAHNALGAAEYLQAAERTYLFMNNELWSDSVGVYRSRPGAKQSVYTPIDLAVALGAVREMALVKKDMDEIHRFKVLHVQSINRSGIMQAEEADTGETDLAILDAKGDGDKDGIPHFTRAGGKHGRAAVYASRVMIQTP